MTLSRAVARSGTIRHHVPYEQGPEAACAWCGDPTDVSAETPFRPDIGRLPMHLFCSPEVLAAWRRFQAGLVLTEREQAGMARLAGLPARLEP
jgi:hypothetical protein